MGQDTCPRGTILFPYLWPWRPFEASYAEWDWASSCAEHTGGNIKSESWDFLGGPVVGLCASPAGGTDAAPGQGNKIPPATQHSHHFTVFFLMGPNM